LRCGDEAVAANTGSPDDDGRQGLVYLFEGGTMVIEEGSQWSIHSEIVKHRPKSFRPRFTPHPPAAC
jgi:hypothetical protein